MPDLPGRPTAATVRRTLIQILSANGASTLKALEEEVGRILPAAERPSVKQQLEVLREGDYVVETQDDTRKLALSEAGRRWSVGIEALSPHAA